MSGRAHLSTLALVAAALGLGPQVLYAASKEPPRADNQMVRIPAGQFMMGRVKKGLGKARPIHQVHLDAFYMDRTEVTQQEYQKLMGKNPSFTKGEKLPVGSVTWFDAARYCNARSKAEGLQPCYDEKTWTCDFTKNGYRLPTEAEWEYACRAGSRTEYHFGADRTKLGEYANYWPEAEMLAYREAMRTTGIWNKPLPRVLPVGERKPNQWGLYDMMGNVREWCNDWYDPHYYRASPKGNPRGPAKPSPADSRWKVLRGGSCKDSWGSCRSGRRCAHNADGPLASLGFRCVRAAGQEERK